MALELPPITKDDVAATSWEKHLTKAQERTCFAYVPVLTNAIVEAETRGAEKETAVLRLLTWVASMALKADDGTVPFRSKASGPGWRMPEFDDFSEEHFDLLNEILPDVTDSEMKARIGDMLWVKRRDHKAAHIAVAAYLSSAKTLEDHIRWPEGFHRLERAIYLGLHLGGVTWDQVREHVDRVLTDSESVTVPSFFIAKLLTVLYKARKNEPVRLAALAELHAQKAEAAEGWSMAQTYWDLAAKYWQRGGDQARGRTASINGAEAYVKEGLATTVRSYSAAAHHVTRAIQAYRKIGGEKSRVEELHRSVLDYQKRALESGEFKPYSAEINISEMVQRAKSAVQRKTFEEAIFVLCRLAKPPVVADLRKEAESQASQFIFSSSFPSSILDAEGKLIAQRGPIRGIDAKEDDDALTAQMYKNSTMQRDLAAAAYIDPAIREIRDAHPASTDDFAKLILNNPFVPPGREHLFAEGLRAGLAGELAVALHLLMPQVENSIREVLRQRGALTSTLDATGIQEERDLNTLLYVPQALEVFGEDQLFELRGLLIKRFGANLRNRMAHGLLSSSECYSGQSLYFWWLTLRLVMTGHLLMRRSAAAHEESEESE